MLLMRKLFKLEMAEGGSLEEHFRELKEDDRSTGSDRRNRSKKSIRLQPCWQVCQEAMDTVVSQPVYKRQCDVILHSRVSSELRR